MPNHYKNSYWLNERMLLLWKLPDGESADWNPTSNKNRRSNAPTKLFAPPTTAPYRLVRRRYTNIIHCVSFSFKRLIQIYHAERNRKWISNSIV